MKAMKKVISCLLASVFVFMACSPTVAGDYSEEDRIILVREMIMVERDETETRSLQNTDLADSAARVAARGANDFAFRLSAALAQNLDSENLVVSPYSVWLPLAALVNATDSYNQEALLEALGAAGINAEDINRAASRMLYDLTNERLRRFEGLEEISNPLRIANAIFVDNEFTIREDFAQTFMDYFRGSIMNVDFSSPDAVAAVNQWASDNTDGLITDLIEAFDPLELAVIANAIYFSGRWGWEFNPDNTIEGTFYSPVGEMSAYFMVRESDNQLYFEDENIQSISMWFQNGGGMTIILPKDGDATGLLSNMTAEYFDNLMQNKIMATGRFLLPRFSLSSQIDDLAEVLVSLGVPLFDDITAPLTNGLLEESIPVWLSNAVQKAVIEVNEEGATAAAVTAVMVAGSAMPIPTEPFEMICDRPFVFVLYGQTFDGGQQVLFTGVVNQP